MEERIELRGRKQGWIGEKKRELWKQEQDMRKGDKEKKAERC